jgi:NTE family protein
MSDSSGTPAQQVERTLPNSPVRLIPTDPPDPVPEAGIALCLSGGGYRAMLYHLGAVWRLNELGFLPQLKRVSSVSGGSITAGVLAMNWQNLAFDSAGVATAFQPQVVEPIRKLARRTIDLPAVLAGFATLGLLGALTDWFYSWHLFGCATMQDLPDVPRFVFNATSVQSGVLWRFSKPYMWDYRVGQVPEPHVKLAVAVAASSAFPPFLSPVILRPKPNDFRPGTGLNLQFQPYTSRVILTDGGVYDNLGLETAWKRYQTILVSDACGTTGTEQSPHRDWFRQIYRVLMVIDTQVGSLRKRQLIDSFKASQRSGTYWGIGTPIAAYKVSDALPAPAEATTRLAAFETRLRKVPSVTQDRLINWGYAVCDAAMRAHMVKDAPAPSGFPYPLAGVGA